MKVFRNGRNRAVRIPREFDFPGDDVLMRKEGDTITLKPVQKMPLIDLLATLKPIEDDFGEIPELPIDQPPELG